MAEIVEMMKQKTYRARLVAVFAVLALLFCLRAYDLEADPPPWGTVNYQPGDEGPYITMAITSYNYGTVNPDEDVEDIDFWTAPSVKENLLQNILAYVGLTTFGDNYYGIRLSSVAINLLNYILTFLILLKLQKKYGKGEAAEYLAIGAAMLLLLVDYVFLVSSRVVEPTISRLLFVQLTVLTCLGMKEGSKIGCFFMGFLTVSSIFLVYISNLFLGLAFCILLAGIWKHGGVRAFVTAFFSYAAGCIAALAISEAYFFKFWGTEAIMNGLASIFGDAGFLGATGYGQAIGLRGIVKACVHFLSANINLYNLPILFLLMLAVPFCLWSVWKKRDDAQLFLIALPVSLLLQTMFSNDYIIRKYLVIYPVSMYLIFIWLCSADETWTPSSPWLKKYGVVIKRVYICACALACVVVPMFRLFLIHDDGTIRDFSRMDKAVILLAGCSAVAVMVLRFWKPADKKEVTWKVLAVSVALGLCVNAYMGVKYVVMNRTYGDKEAMELIGQVVGDNYCLGFVSPGWTLYNDIKPIHNDYLSTVEMVELNPTKYYFLDYTAMGDGAMRNYFDNIVFRGSAYTVRQILSIKRDFQAFGTARRLGIYEISVK